MVASAGMKAIICAVRSGVHIHSPGSGHWETCQCGAVAARWEDPEAGTVIVAASPADRDRVRGLGLNNHLLVPALTSPSALPEDFRRWHETATDAPGFLFERHPVRLLGGAVRYRHDLRYALGV